MPQSKMIEIPHELYAALCDLEAFVRDCCITGHIERDNPIAGMSEDKRTVSDVLTACNELRGA